MATVADRFPTPCVSTFWTPGRDRPTVGVAKTKAGSTDTEKIGPSVEHAISDTGRCGSQEREGSSSAIAPGAVDGFSCDGSERSDGVRDGVPLETRRQYNAVTEGVILAKERDLLSGLGSPIRPVRSAEQPPLDKTLPRTLLENRPRSSPAAATGCNINSFERSAPPSWPLETGYGSGRSGKDPTSIGRRQRDLGLTAFDGTRASTDQLRVSRQPNEELKEGKKRGPRRRIDGGMTEHAQVRCYYLMSSEEGEEPRGKG